MLAHKKENADRQLRSSTNFHPQRSSLRSSMLKSRNAMRQEIARGGVQVDPYIKQYEQNQNPAILFLGNNRS